MKSQFFNVFSLPKPGKGKAPCGVGAGRKAGNDKSGKSLLGLSIEEDEMRKYYNKSLLMSNLPIRTGEGSEEFHKYGHT